MERKIINPTPSKDNMDTMKKANPIVAYCPEDIAKIHSKEAALSRAFHVAELNSPNKIHVHLRAYTDFLGGYAEHGRRVLFGLDDSGECVLKLHPIPTPIDTDPNTFQRCSFFTRNPAFNTDKSILLTIAGPGWAQEQFCSTKRYSVIWTMTETLTAYPEMKKWLSNMNEIWLPTMCDIQRFSNLELKNVYKMPLGYDPIRYNISVEPMDIFTLRGRYVFMVLGSWNDRKGIRDIIEAFCLAFGSRDPVSLLLVCKYATRPYDGNKDGEQVTINQKEVWDSGYEYRRYVSEYKDIPHITLCDIPVHEHVLPHLCAVANCCVGFSMGESTWLPGLEMGAMGKPIIQLSSQCSGFMDYLDDGNSYLCKKVDYIDAPESLYLGTSDYYRGMQFAKGCKYELAEMMKKVYHERNSDTQRYKINRLHERLKDWTWDHSIKNVINRLKEIKH